MKVLICYDGYIFKTRGRYYFSEIDKLLIQRYLRIFERIVLVLRTKEVKEIDDFYSVLIDDPRIDIFEVPMFQGPKEYFKVYFKVKHSLAKACENVELGIFRLPSTIGFVTCEMFIKERKPYLVEVVANPHEALQTIKNPFIKLLMIFIHKNLTKACEYAKAVSYVTSIKLPKLYPPKIGAYTTNYSSVELSLDYFFKRENFFNLFPFKIIHVANNITPADYKGNVIALKVIRELITKGYDVNIIFVGERFPSNLFDNISEKFGIQERVNFIGRKTRNELRELYIKSDLLLFPSQSEGLPRTVIEACAVGLPCVASNVGGISEIIDDEVIFQVDDYLGMANKIAEVITNNETYKRLSNNNYERAKLFERSGLEERRDRFYKLLLSENPS